MLSCRSDPAASGSGLFEASSEENIMSLEKVASQQVGCRHLEHPLRCGIRDHRDLLRCTRCSSGSCPVQMPSGRYPPRTAGYLPCWTADAVPLQGAGRKVDRLHLSVKRYRNKDRRMEVAERVHHLCPSTLQHQMPSELCGCGLIVEVAE